MRIQISVTLESEEDVERILDATKIANEGERGGSIYVQIPMNKDQIEKLIKTCHFVLSPAPEFRTITINFLEDK